MPLNRPGGSFYKQARQLSKDSLATDEPANRSRKFVTAGNPCAKDNKFPVTSKSPKCREIAKQPSSFMQQPAHCLGRIGIGECQG
jgi:hypothetical protein